MVSPRPVGRPREGDVRKEQSATAVRAYIAGQLHGRFDAEFLRRELEVSVSTTAVRRAGSATHRRPANYVKPGPKPSTEQESHQNGAIRDWLATDTRALSLGAAVITVPAETPHAQATIYQAIAHLLGIVHAFACGDGATRKVVAVAVVDGEDDRAHLRARLDDIALGWSWDDIDHETVEPALATWRHLTRRAANAEGLQLGRLR